MFKKFNVLPFIWPNPVWLKVKTNTTIIFNLNQNKEEFLSSTSPVEGNRQFQSNNILHLYFPNLGPESNQKKQEEKKDDIEKVQEVK